MDGANQVGLTHKSSLPPQKFSNRRIRVQGPVANLTPSYSQRSIIWQLRCGGKNSLFILVQGFSKQDMLCGFFWEWGQSEESRNGKCGQYKRMEDFRLQPGERGSRQDSVLVREINVQLGKQNRSPVSWFGFFQLEILRQELGASSLSGSFSNKL